MNNPLVEAIINASEELHETYGWSLDECGYKRRCHKDDVFVQVMVSHIAPLLNEGVMGLMLEAEAIALEKQAEGIRSVLNNYWGEEE